MRSLAIPLDRGAERMNEAVRCGSSQECFGLGKYPRPDLADDHHISLFPNADVDQTWASTGLERVAEGDRESEGQPPVRHQVQRRAREVASECLAIARDAPTVG